jgi:hypothetical protein
MRQQRTWQVRRTGVPMATGQQRWDRAYQHLLQWAATPLLGPAVAPEPSIQSEMCHAGSDLRPRLDRPPGRAADH